MGLLVLIVSAGTSGCDRPSQPHPPAQPAAHTGNLQEIIRNGDTNAFHLWLSQAETPHAPDAQGYTPLALAVRYGQIAMAADLLDRGADVHQPLPDGGALLHRAAAHGNAELTRLLLDAGADVTAVDAEGLSAYDHAILRGHLETAAYLQEIRAVYLALTRGELPPPEATTETIPPALLLSTDFRSWTSLSGDRMEAAFIQSVFDTVILQNRDGELFRIALNRLIPADQTTIRQLSGLDPHALARARERVTITPKASDSLALRIGRDKGWTVLENCRLLKRGGNDGDSFHVRHDGKEYIFRLYFVDAAETSLSFPQRVRDQEQYFGLNTSDTLKLGEAASKFATSLLASGPFTVVTQWEDARGNSRLPRHYAMVVTSLGDLDELLVKEGLVRRFGMPVKTSLGERKQSVLRQLEQEAKRQQAGAWAKSDERRVKR
ncbi:MAG TPA: ankyrin repeat domain-containing protein [Kiritimatiellia bacterium]|nr:ankyrin repeat domain-containing protein [Kiritimatiellia bacterium]